MNQKILAIAGLLIAGFVLAGSASALGGEKGAFHRFFVSEDMRTQLDSAIANHDYAAFKQIQAETFPDAPVMTEEQFNQIVAHHENAAQIDAAIESGNYAEWKTLMEQQANPHSQILLKKINAANFHYLTELKQAQDKIKEINAELGIEGPAMGMAFKARGPMHNGMGNRPFTTSAPQ